MTGNISGITFSVQASQFKTGSYNTTVGFNSLSLSLNGSYNTAIGNYTLANDKYGILNTAVGYGALYNNTGRLDSNVFGCRSTAIGCLAMYNNIEGIGVAIGDSALYNNTYGEWNIAIGNQAGSAITTGSGNTIIATTGFTSFAGITTGNNNLIIAQNNGNTTGITTGSNNTIVGKVSGLAAGLTASVIISNGSGATRFFSDSSGKTTISDTLYNTSFLSNLEVISASVSATASLVVYDYSLSSLWYHATASTNFTANFTNLPTTDNRVLSATIVISQGATAYIPNIVQIAGVTQSIKWAGGTQSGTANSLDLISFNFIRTGNTWTNVIGQIAPFS
jgi:hypothetical protein